MNYYGVIFYKGESPNGRSYTFKSETEHKPGDVVEVQGHRKAMVSGVIAEEDIDYDLSKVQSIVGRWKEDTDAEG